MNSLLEPTAVLSALDWLNNFSNTQGIMILIFLLLIEEMDIPLPVPGEVIMVLIGYEVSKGHLSYLAAIALLSAAVLIGTSILYFLSCKYGNRIVVKFGHFIRLNEQKLVSVEQQFKKYGPWVIVFGRLVPGLRIPITFFAGMSGVSYRTFMLCTLLSSFIWIPFYLHLGMWLGPTTMLLLRSHPVYTMLAFMPGLLILATLIIINFKASGKEEV